MIGFLVGFVAGLMVAELVRVRDVDRAWRATLAAVKGYGLVTLPVGEVYQSLQAVSRHRHNLVKQRSRLMVQIRRLLHQTMPGFADRLDAAERASVAKREAVAEARDHGARSPRGEWCQFGGDEDDVHGAIVAETGT